MVNEGKILRDHPIGIIDKEVSKATFFEIVQYTPINWSFDEIFLYEVYRLSADIEIINR